MTITTGVELAFGGSTIGAIGVSSATVLGAGAAEDTDGSISGVSEVWLSVSAHP